jgi:hypothetical protein
MHAHAFPGAACARSVLTALIFLSVGRQNISTPIITAYLDKHLQSGTTNQNKRAAELVKARVEKTTLGASDTHKRRNPCARLARVWRFSRTLTRARG